MKTLVLYESKYGNTERIAEAITSELGGKILHVSEFKLEHLTNIDLLVVGSPIHGWQPSAETIHFLSRLENKSLKDIYVAAFDTGYKTMMAGNAAPKILRMLEKAGGTQLAPTQKFIVTQSEGPLVSGEAERAQTWANYLKDVYEHKPQLAGSK
jgi:flavodoxin